MDQNQVFQPIGDGRPKKFWGKAFSAAAVVSAPAVAFEAARKATNWESFKACFNQDLKSVQALAAEIGDSNNHKINTVWKETGKALGAAVAVDFVVRRIWRTK